MPPSEHCRCGEGEEERLPFSLAVKALQRGPVADETIIAFRNSLAEISCLHHDLVPFSAFYQLIWEYAYHRAWGEGRQRTMPDDITADIARELGFQQDHEPWELTGIVHSFLDKAVGRHVKNAASYDPRRSKNPARPMSARAFVRHQARSEALRVFARDGRNIAFEELDSPPSRTEEDGGVQPAARVRRLRELSEERVGEIEIEVALLQHALLEAAQLIAAAGLDELTLLGLLDAIVSQHKMTDLQRANRRRALRVLRRALRGKPGHSIVLDTGIDVLSRGISLPLATRVSRRSAERIYKTANAAVFANQVRQWTDTVLGLIARDPQRAATARALALSALEKRALAHYLLEALGDTLARLDAGDTATLVALWRGPPGRDRTDTANGRRGVGGIGIAEIPFLFGLLDPLAEDVAGLDALIAEGDEK